MPISFIENRGQVDSRVAYYLAGRGSTALFTSSGVTLATTGPGATDRRYALRMRFVGGRAVTPVGEELQRGTASSFVGPRSAWRTRISMFGRIVYPDVWPGIDVRFSGTQSGLEYSFVVHPGADPAAIGLTYAGATSLGLQAGDLMVGTPIGPIADLAPRSFQRAGDALEPVASSYRLLDRNRVGFELGAYDSSRTLVIDPVLLAFSGFMGGSADEVAFSVAVDGSGNSYVTGATNSTDFNPLAVGAPLSAHHANYDVFVAKVTPAGQLAYVGFLGGSGDDLGFGIAVDGAGKAYIAGRTTSSDFPFVVGPLSTPGGGADGFVSAIAADASALVYSGYLDNGSGDEAATAITVDSAGNAFITGTLNSLCNSSNRISSDGGSRALGGIDVRVESVAPTGTLVYGYCYGGSAADVGLGIARDAAGNLYLAGQTTSQDFPHSDTSFGGVADGFVSEVTVSPSSFVIDYARFLGGSGVDSGDAIAVDGAGNAFVTGLTTSADFPRVVGPDLSLNGGADAFVTEVAAGGSSLVYSGFVGGFGYDEGFGIAVGPGGTVMLGGATLSLDFPVSIERGARVTCASIQPGDDAFVASVKGNGSGLAASALLVGSDVDIADAVAAAPGADTVVVGSTSSKDFLLSKGPGLTFNGGPEDAFVTRVNLGSGVVGGSGLLDFASDRGNKRGLFDLWISTTDGSCAYHFVFKQGHVSNAPVWSPDTTEIAFTSNVKNNVDIYALKFTNQGTKFVRLTKGKSQDKEPAWSPNGKQIVFASDQGNKPGALDIWVMDDTGKHAHRLVGGPLTQEVPVWFGNTILYQGLDPDTGVTRIFSFNVKSHAVKTLTKGPSDKFPNWAPDGKQIVFQRSNQIYTMTASGKNARKIPHQPNANNSAPAWSPDGEQIAFFSDKGGCCDIWTISPSGKHLTQVTSGKSEEIFPRWLPIVGASGSSVASYGTVSEPLARGFRHSITQGSQFGRWARLISMGE